MSKLVQQKTSKLEQYGDTQAESIIEDFSPAVMEEDHKQVHIIKEETSWEGNQLGDRFRPAVYLNYSRAAQNEVHIILEQYKNSCIQEQNRSAQEQMYTRAVQMRSDQLRETRYGQTSSGEQSSLNTNIVEIILFKLIFFVLSTSELYKRLYQEQQQAEECERRAEKEYKCRKAQNGEQCLVASLHTHVTANVQDGRVPRCELGYMP
ncbi:hypothetical protein F511_30491 [Dorcoceras hygrometricum]|uniref:Uncharacterized protein n=1 Tax=Dorcoceras hygrometricum TaxID=472368 RepID=A0A2Z7AX22_9LAMI|nr:hypothetical protein F511_30491 [Dorcoceras hygrometricum]